MESYKAILSIETPIGTPLIASTLWGHICWGILYHKGEAALKSFIGTYRSNEPAIILSDPFPLGWLPMPRLSARQCNDDHSSGYDQFEKNRRMAKQAWIRNRLFFDSCPISRERLMSGEQSDDEEIPRFIKFEITRNMVDRLGGGTIEGVLYRSVSWMKDNGKEPDHRELYIWSTTSLDQIEKWLCWGLETGYGAKASVGKGKIRVLSIETANWPTSGNRLLALSAFVSTKEIHGHCLNAHTTTHYGKVSGSFIHIEKPFKMPIVMFETGATLSAEYGKSFCGSLVEGIHDNSEIVNLGMAPLVPFIEETV